LEAGKPLRRDELLAAVQLAVAREAPRAVD
jgi:hypothetical protein